MLALRSNVVRSARLLTERLIVWALLYISSPPLSLSCSPLRVSKSCTAVDKRRMIFGTRLLIQSNPFLLLACR